jgi:S1-C subfamily serine protease
MPKDDICRLDYSNVIERIKPSIVFIVCFDKDGRNQGSGSGFIFLKKNVVITCNHVIKDASAISVKFSDSTDGSFITAKVAVRDEEHDLVLLKVSGIEKEPLKLANIDDIKEGMPIIFAGYPLNIASLTTHRGMLSAIATDDAGITTYLIDGTVNAGNSGCPLMNEDGEVLGILNAKRMERADVLSRVNRMEFGALSLYGVDMVRLYQALISNLQLGIGYAIPVSYVPEYKEISKKEKTKKVDRKR